MCDTDGVLFACGEGKRDFSGKTLSPEIDKLLKERKSYVASEADGGTLIPITVPGDTNFSAQIVVPVVSGGDCLGAVALLYKEAGARVDADAVKLVRLTAEILANQFE